MRHTTSPRTIFCAALLACYLQTRWVVTAAPDEPPMKPEDSNNQLDAEMSKRDWNKNLGMWGKRGWQSLHGGWGLKRDSGSWDDSPNDGPIFDEKRAWRNLQGGWGKRSPAEDEYVLQQQLLTWLENQQQPLDTDYILEAENAPGTEVKRAWNKLSNGWGKRADSWKSFRGSWGKREPAWNNLKGIWGKRSYMDSSIQ